ncbi:hypothetical protein ACWD4P_12825 [Kitasatospora sp. NPDC002543]
MKPTPIHPTIIRSAVAAVSPSSIPLPRWTREELAPVLSPEVLAQLVVLRDAVHSPGVALDASDVAVSGRTVTLTAWSIRELSSWFTSYPTAGVAVSSRPGGGLVWQLHLGQVVPGVSLTVGTESAEDETLPDTALVRAMFPAEARLRAIREREAAAARRMGWVA